MPAQHPLSRSDNPLLKITQPIPFANVLPQHIGPAIDTLLQQANVAIQKLTAQEATAATYQSSFLAFEELLEPLHWAMSIISHLEAAVSTPELRQAYNDVLPKVAAFQTSIYLNQQLWKLLTHVSTSQTTQQCTAVEKRFIAKILKEFKRQGAGLPNIAQKRLSIINQQLAEQTAAFSQAVVDATGEFYLDIDDETHLQGLPEHTVIAARQRAQEKKINGWRLTLQTPDVMAILTYADSRSLRQQIYQANHQRASQTPHRNQERIGEILALRQEKAALLGYKNFADFVLEERMAGNGQVALDFVTNLKMQTESFFQAENQTLTSFAKPFLQQWAATKLEAWDTAYIAEKLRQHAYQFDEEQLRPYFPLDHVLQGMFALVKQVFAVDVIEHNKYSKSFPPVWHEDVRFFDLFYQGKHVASFYADFFPRQNKRGGAWMADLYTASWENGTSTEQHLGLICANLTPPTQIGQPTLLLHSEVETIFHEFGHLLHHALSQVEVKSLAGTNVAWDFVELPSQLMENWCWQPQVLAMISQHYETKSPIPPTLLTAMLNAKNFRSANQMMRQLGFAYLDLLLHTDTSAQHHKDILTYARAALEPFVPTLLPENYAMLCSFSHLFASPVAYGAGYYSYKWAEVLDADAFTRFTTEGVLNPTVGKHYVECILTRGDSKAPSQLYHDFMGRTPDTKALLIRSGLITT